jgi:hypothetical protein
VEHDRVAAGGWINPVFLPISDSGRRWWTWMNPANSAQYFAPKSNPQTMHAVPNFGLHSCTASRLRSYAFTVTWHVAPSTSED